MTKNMTCALWTIQILLALLFAFSGVVKLVSPIAVLAAEFPLPSVLIRTIGVFEILGALGLILPQLLNIFPILTPIAALCLVVIMVGAIYVTITTMGFLPALMPIIVGLLCIFVVRKRWPHAF